jgi:hypothetical protein
MDPIGRTSRLAAPLPEAPPASRGAGGIGFALPAATGAAAPAAAGALGPLLAVQESAAEAPADQRARRRARGLLAELTALQRDLLADAVSTGRLDRLAALAREAAAGTAATPTLEEAVQAIVLRARIELARFGRS